CRSRTMDFSFSFMQGIMGNTIQQPPQLIDSANIRQEDAYNASSDLGQDGGPSTYESALESGFCYPPSASEDLPGITNGYPPAMGLYESQAKYTITPPHPSAPVLPNASKKTGSPEIKLKITKTYHNGRELFESSLCGDLQHQAEASDAPRRRHERKKEKRKRSGSRHGWSAEFQSLSVQIQKQSPAVVPGSGSCKDHQVGDLVWAKVGTYPWWPCMVSCDPQAKIHTRINTRGHQEYHVQFFGSVPERAWIHEKRVVVYQGKHQFEELQAETLRKTSNPAERHKLLKPIPQRERAQWEVGIGHAEDAFLMTREERVENYTFIYVDEVPGTSPPPASKTGRGGRRSRGSAGGREDNPGSLAGEHALRPLRYRALNQRMVAQQKCVLSSPSGASEISDSCKPLKKRSRASTDVETSHSQYRDTSDSDSRGLSDPQVGLLFLLYSSVQGFGCVAPQICEQYGDMLVACEGGCCRLFHQECLGLTSLPEGTFTCVECRTGSHTCFSCKVLSAEVKRCSVNGCGRFYHETCARKYPSATSDPNGLRCPQHCCSVARHPKQDSNPRPTGKQDRHLMRCMRCPVAYHTGDNCVAAGSVVITPHIIICSNHSSSKKNGHLTSPVNVGWCFICARGGRLLCCESCPASFHPECLNIEMPEGTWCCSECRAGRKPHYKQIVWVKLGSYRWWPAEICNPRLVPFNIQTLKHDIGEFPVFFFGSHDYYWIGRGRVFPYVESDRNFAEGQMGINKTFKKALEEAARRFQELKAQRESREALEQERNSRRPPPYKFIKSNKPVGKVQVHVADLSEIPRCSCKPTDESPCGRDSQCLNRMLQYECHPQVCPAGDRCHNQHFSQRLFAETEVFKTDRCGWGLRTKQDLKKGDFVMEYVGELIDLEECRLRIKHANENRVTNFYMLTLTKDRVIDAGPKGNFSRFMNHSCSPNCETQKWTVNGDVRIGLFTLCDIEAGTELTFNYNLDCLGNGRTSCHCGAENCSGFLGVQPRSAVVLEKEEKARNAKLKPKKRKLKPENRQTHEYFCFCCGEGGELVMCDKKDCPKAYHLLCLNLTKPPFGRWECPWHECSVCQCAAASFCHFCPSSFCREHDRGALVPSALDGRPCCSSHDPQNPLGSQSDLNRATIKVEQPEPSEEPGE
uniref:Histone-lysine N-methyltransferase NSD3 n=1 Tax=Scleropages formosus TaxID=113540 RepID=A0A8C9T3K7_SCLFO